MNVTPPRDRTSALVISLVLGLVQAAYQQMGKLKNEMTGKVETHLDAARITIDTIAALEERTRGNRSDEESQVMERALAELRLNYVDEVKKQAAGAAASAEKPAEMPAAAPAPAAEPGA
jgi:pantothenate synthetase